MYGCRDLLGDSVKVTVCCVNHVSRSQSSRRVNMGNEDREDEREWAML
jgi:hypothetical protein